MSNQTIIDVVVLSSGVLGVAAYVGLILVPAVRSYRGVWQRLLASFMTLYVLAACILLGVAGGAAVVWFWDRYGV
jgi:uncharacterized membrane protein (UPF0182 family)